MTLDSGRNFTEPTPREVPREYRQFEWPAGARTDLGAKLDALNVDLAAVLRSRHSARDFLQLGFPQLATLLWLTARTHSSRRSPYGFAQQYRPYPSAGALHPIHLLCQRGAGKPWERYDSLDHALVDVPGTERLADDARHAVNELLRGQQATVIALAGEPGMTAAKYEQPESLLWRDAGVVLGYLSLVCEALDLAFSPLGMSGNNFVAPIAPSGKLQGVGLAVVGMR